MGQVIEKVTIRNNDDIVKFDLGIIKKDEIREVTIDAIVDTGASYLCLPPEIIKQLNLKYYRTAKIRTGNGPIDLRFFQGGEIFIRERFTIMPVMENKDDSIPALVGVLVLEAMDFVVNPQTGHVEGNPQHDGHWMADMF